jgi:hypothetical protein
MKTVEQPKEKKGSETSQNIGVRALFVRHEAVSY